jgi:hypothetical protein
MSRLVRDFVEVRDQLSLDALIDQLVAIRDGLPAGTGAEVKMKGDDFFGRRLSVSFSRPQTAEEAACDARYMEAYRESLEQAEQRKAA